MPTVTQLVLEIAGLKNAPPEVVRFMGGVPPTAAVNAVNPPAGSISFPPSKAAPLAFVSPPASGSVATVTEPDDPGATSFFYAATNRDFGTPPDTLFLFYDYRPLTTQNFAKGQLVANISIPLVVLNSDGTESEAPTTIQIRGATGCGNTVPCVSATAIGSFGSVKATDLGLTVTLTFAFSPNTPNATRRNAIFEVQVPLLVTQLKDPAYFLGDQTYALNPVVADFSPPAFVSNELGFPSKSLGFVGIGPYAVPLCPPGVNCATKPAPSPQFPFCASIADDASIAANNGTVQPAVAAFYSIGTVGTTYLSAPRDPSGISCPS